MAITASAPSAAGTSSWSWAQGLIAEARRFYAGEPLDLDLEHTVYALDSTTIEFCIELFPWARFHPHASGVKLHTLLDLRGPIPAFSRITPGSYSDSHILDVLTPEPGSIYVFDRAYLDFARLRRLNQAKAIFVTRAKKNQKLRRIYSRPVDRTTGLICDQSVVLAIAATAAKYPEHLRRVRFKDLETGKSYWSDPEVR